MNNDQFRKLMLANQSQGSGSTNRALSSPASATKTTGNAFGFRQRPSIPLTPRSVGAAQFEVSRHPAAHVESDNARKKFKGSIPKGVKLGDGYVDRARNREERQDDERAERLKALEESHKAEQIDQETYEKLRSEIAGGDLETTHLVKGLDFKLLERIRRGEDVYSKKEAGPGDDPILNEAEEDIDEAFEELESEEVHAIDKGQAERKKGLLSTVQTGKKRTRNQILADLKASRAAAKSQDGPSLGDRFRKIGSTQRLGTRIERDRKGREVLIIVDADGHEKRKIRKTRSGENEENQKDLPMPDKNAKPLGMEVPEKYRKREELPLQSDDVVNIFDDVGDDYHLLAGTDNSDSESGEDTKERAETGRGAPRAGENIFISTPASKTVGPGNYFQDSKKKLVSEESPTSGPAMSDPAIMAAIKKAATLRRIETEEDEASRKSTAEAEEKRKRLLQMAARDDDDLDMGFGTSRFEDEEDYEGQSLSSWTKKEGEEGAGRKPQRKRGPKKRKGDVNNAADVLRVMEQRKKT